jgi:hypothetical protein
MSYSIQIGRSGNGKPAAAARECRWVEADAVLPEKSHLPRLEHHQIATLLKFLQTLDSWDREASTPAVQLCPLKLGASTQPAKRHANRKCATTATGGRSASVPLAKVRCFSRVKTGKAECQPSQRRSS